ncbi:alpha/beta hydrolase [Novosphingobium sp. 1949]|uniref:Alpha/beta hydrolase n=1 Tax=Novosphingobium organovorum TaxID=2930092 RepID=A0ABT0BB92_9SPHN|nr:alpha/beta hydrolase [Novosphingobium organovorum]MCJ2182332.1 alpha/beta hydrolase [Novosphingobium organovorum]
MIDAPQHEGPRPSRRSIPSDAREDRWHARDGFAIRRLTIPARGAGWAQRGSILFMPGRGDCYEKWLETLEGWADAGWHVTSADWRGQGLSGRLGDDAITGHVDDFAPWVDDYTTLWNEWKAQTPAPHVAMGHSMGGNLVLRAVAERRVEPDALVLSAPMLGLHPTWAPSGLLLAIARVICALGLRRKPAWKASERPELLPRDRQHLLTHDASRYADEQWWYAQRPGLVMGPASWGWIASALDSIVGLEEKPILETLDLPVLLLGTRVDGLVSWPAIRKTAARLPNGELVGYSDECAHEILRESDPVRNHALAEIEAFLKRALGARG